MVFGTAVPGADPEPFLDWAFDRGLERALVELDFFALVDAGLRVRLALPFELVRELDRFAELSCSSSKLRSMRRLGSSPRPASGGLGGPTTLSGGVSPRVAAAFFAAAWRWVFVCAAMGLCPFDC